MATTAELVSLRNIPWKYRGEGNGNMVLALENTGHILRLVKVDIGHPLASGQVATSEVALLHEDTRLLYQLVGYTKDTVAPLVGRKFIHPGEVVCVSGEDLCNLNVELHSVMRPDFRKGKILPQSDCFALRMLDHCSKHVLRLRSPNAIFVGPVLTVEIKPKMGFLRDQVTQNTPGGESDVITTVCKFHRMQPWKLKKGKISEISDYCPLDLFSGCRIRTLYALKELLRNPQNNLKIFLNGRLVFDEKNYDVTTLEEILKEFLPESSVEIRKDRLCALLLDALLMEHSVDDTDIPLPEFRPFTQVCRYREVLSDAKGSTGVADNQENADHSCQNCLLPRGCIMHRVLAMQNISELDAGGLLPLYLQVKGRLDAMPAEEIRELLYGPEKLPKVLADPGSFEDIVAKIRKYLLSCTANDCSMMVTMGRIDVTSPMPVECGPWILKDRDVTYGYSIALVDTDWKPYARISSHANQEAQYVQHILEKRS